MSSILISVAFYSGFVSFHYYYLFVYSIKTYCHLYSDKPGTYPLETSDTDTTCHINSSGPKAHSGIEREQDMHNIK